MKMLLNDFLNESINSIKAGIHDFNNRDPKIQAYLPEKVDFDISVIISEAEIFVVNQNEKESNIARLKITIPIAYRPWEK